MDVKNDPLNPVALSIEEAEGEIRRLIRDELYRIVPTAKAALDAKAKAIVKRAVISTDDLNLRRVIWQGLLVFYERQYRAIRALSEQDRLLYCALAIMSKWRKNPSTVTQQQMQWSKQTLSLNGVPFTQSAQRGIRLSGVPAQMYAETYFERKVKPVFEQLLKQEPKDPGDISGRNSLRNRAEMEVRYRKNMDSVDNLRNAGHKLVVASSHADCSERCRPWQGRVYSLDGTSGTTPDGRTYIPLETATDIWYTTKAGVRYKNGLLGFNCRHYLVPYGEGRSFPRVDAATEKREYAITVRQRAMERNVRKWRTEAMMRKGSPNGYAAALKRAKAAENEYIAFCRKNERAWYKSRIKII